MAVGQIYQHQATGEWLRAGGVLLGGTPPPLGNQPTGPGIVRYQDKYVSGDRITATQARMSSPAMMSYPAAVFQDADFAEGSGKIMGYIPSVCTGMLGSGVDLTVFQMVPGSSTKTAPTTGTNGLYLFRTQTSPAGGFTMSSFTLCGTEQPVDPNKGRPHAYNGFMLDHVNAPQISDVRDVGIPGSGNSPPDECFAHNDFGCTNSVYIRFEGDGRIGVGTGSWYTPSFYNVGDRVGSSPLGFNSSTGPTLTDVYIHHSYAGMITFWQTNGATTYNLRSEHNGSGSGLLSGHGVNHERPSGVYEHNNPTIIIDRTPNGANTGLHMSLMGDQGNTNGISLRGMVPGINFDQIAGTPLRSCFSVQMHAAGVTYQGNPTTQTFPPHLYKPNGAAFTADSGSVPSGADPTSEFGVFL